jgi:integrase
LHPTIRSCDNLCMKGAIRTKEKCSQCGGAFREVSKGFFCPTCGTSPQRYFVDWRLGKEDRIRKYTDDKGYPFTSYEAARRYLTVMRAKKDSNEFDPREYIAVEIKKIQFDNYAQTWMRNRRAKAGVDRLASEYLRSIESYFKNYLIPYFGMMSIREIHEGHVEKFRDQLPPKLKPKTVSNILASLHKMLKDAQRYKDILYIPDIPKVKVPDPETKWAWEDIQEQVLAEIRNPIYKACIQFLMLQGCRPGEARALRWPALDFEKEIRTPDGQVIKGVVTIRAAMDQETFMEHTKEGDVRVLPMHPKAKEILKGLPRCMSGYVFAYRGRPIQKKSLSRCWHDAAKRVGADLSLYQGTRHSFASQAINSGCPKHLIGAFLGHKDPKSTERYAHLETGPLVQAWARSGPQVGHKVVNGRGNVLEFKPKKV